MDGSRSGGRRDVPGRRWLFGLLPVAAGLLIAPAPVDAQELADYDYENLAFRGIGFNVGGIWPSKVEPTGIFGIRLDLGYLGPGIRIVPSLSFWSGTMQREELDRLAAQINQLTVLAEQGTTVEGSDLGPIDWSDLALGLEGHFVWTTPVDLLPYVGLGAGLHALNGQGDAIEDTFVEDLLDTITAGIAAVAGLEYPLGDRLRVYAEARWTMLSDIHYGGLQAGGAIMLPGRGVEVGSARVSPAPAPPRGRMP